MLLHCSRKNFECFKTGRDLQRRSEHNVYDDQSGRFRQTADSAYKHSHARKGQVDGQITREASRSNGAPHDSPSSIAPELPRQPTRGPPGGGSPNNA